MDTHWFDLTKKKVRQHAGTTVRILGSAVLFATVLAPMPQQQSTTEAGSLSWGDSRPMLTTNEDTSSSGGFDALAAFGSGMHAITVADNGDIFAAGGRNIFRSTDDGATWSDWPIPVSAVMMDASEPGDNPDTDAIEEDFVVRAATNAVFGMGDAGVVRKIVTSPNYSSDGFVAFVFSSDADGEDGTDSNGFCYSSTEGEDWTCYNGTEGAPWSGTRFMSLTLEPKFSGDGDIVLAGGGDNETISINSSALGQDNGEAAPGLTRIMVPGPAQTDACPGTVLDVSYNANERPEVLGRVIQTDDGVFGQLFGDEGWPSCADNSRSEVMDDDQYEITDATAGSIGFDSNYVANDVYFVSVSGTANALPNMGGVFLYGGSWEELTAGERDCDGGYDSLTVGGEDGDTILVGSMSDSNVVCSSDDEGGDWSDTTLGSNGCEDYCELDIGVSQVALHRDDPDVVYSTSAGMLGSVMRSSNTGGSFQETGLTNLAYVTGGPNERSTSMAFAAGTAPNGMDALFQTNNYGGNAEWQRVLTYNGSDLRLVSPSSDFATASTMHAIRNNATDDVVLRSTNGGVSWDVTSADPFDDSDEDNEAISGSAISQRSANTLVAGGNKGTIAITTDGGSTWTNIDPDPRSSGRVDELDFISGTMVYVVTLENTRGVYTPLLTTDGGATFAEIGDPGNAWGKDGSITYRNETFDGTTGMALVIISGATSNGIWRYDADAASPKWTKVQSGGNWSSGFSVGAPGIGDGRLLILYNSAEQQIVRTYYPYTMTTSSDWDAISLSMEPPANRGAPGTARGSSGLTLQVTNGGRVQDYTLTSGFQSGISLRSPANGGTVPTNQGAEGITSIFRWQSVADAECYDVQLSLNEEFSALTLDGTSHKPDAGDNDCPATGAPGVARNASLAMSGSSISGTTALIQGESYWWRVRVRATDKSFDNAAGEQLNQGPWSAVSTFSVSSTSTQVTEPKASLPLHGSQLPGLGTQLSWNNPPSVTQVQVQVTPLNGDGPGINLIFGSLITSYNVPAPVFGEGPYLMLPGSTYTWRVRVTNAGVAVDENHPSWGPWSDPRTFSTAPPSAGTLALVSPIGGVATSDATPSLLWKDANSAMFYYEVQLSADPNFGQNGAVAPVYWNLVHGGEAAPPNSWTVPDDFALTSGTYHWRVRQRVQATPLASAEQGIAWSPTQTFVVN
jgi:hypothetical protein